MFVPLWTWLPLVSLGTSAPAVTCRFAWCKDKSGQLASPPPLHWCVRAQGRFSSVEKEVLRALKRRPSTWSAVSRPHGTSSPPPSHLRLRGVCGHWRHFFECEWGWLMRAFARTLRHDQHFWLEPRSGSSDVVRTCITQTSTREGKKTVYLAVYKSSNIGEPVATYVEGIHEGGGR